VCVTGSCTTPTKTEPTTAAPTPSNTAPHRSSTSAEMSTTSAELIAIFDRFREAETIVHLPSTSG